MNRVTNDWIVIDVNVFEHMLNPRENIDDHITDFLTTLANDNIYLLVDNEDRITNEYNSRLGSYMNNKTVYERGTERYLLDYWLYHHTPDTVSVEKNSSLMIEIKKIMHTKRGKPITDRFYVYVAFKKGRILVTNDRVDIRKKWPILKKKTKKLRSNGADILTSSEVYGKL